MADTYRHGVYTSEVPTSLTPMISVAAPTVVVGTAVKGAVNVPTLCHTLKEFTEEFGWSDDFTKYTLCEAAYVHFQLFNVAPVVFVNVLQGLKSATFSVNATTPIKESGEMNTAGSAPNDLTLSSIETVEFVVDGSSEHELTATTDYTATLSGTTTQTLKITLTTAGKTKVNAWLGSGSDHAYDVKVTYAIDPATVTATDIVGGYDANTGKNTGLECIEEVYPRFGLIPGTIIAPKYSGTSTVAAALKAKSTNINGVFMATAISDLDTNTVRTYSGVNAAKNNDNFIDPELIVTWAKVGLGEAQMHLSTQVAALMGKVDAAHDDIPYKSPSNENLQCDRMLLEDGTEIFLGKSQANYLNGLGVVTALNFVGGWKCWGNRTSAYPSNTDPKDSFIPCRRMMNWVSNTLVTSFWSKIDDPVNKRLIESTVDRAQIWLNGLVARGALVGGRVEFREDENPVTDLADGKIRFHVYICPPTPAREIEFIQEMDVSYFSTLFE